MHIEESCLDPVYNSQYHASFPQAIVQKAFLFKVFAFYIKHCVKNTITSTSSVNLEVGSSHCPLGRSIDKRRKDCFCVGSKASLRDCVRVTG